MNILAEAPGALWTAIITALTLLAAWLTQYFGLVAWVPALAGFLIAVLVPVLKVLAQQQEARGPRGPYMRSKFSRWLL